MNFLPSGWLDRTDTRRQASGSWNGHVYLQIPPREFLTFEVDSLLASLPVELQKIQPCDWHLSLSKPFNLSHHLILSFQRSLEAALDKLQLAPFVISVDTSKVLRLPSADAPSKLYLSFAVLHCPALVRLLSVVDQTMSTFALPRFFDPPIFHVSFAVASVDDPLDIVWKSAKGPYDIYIADVSMKIGNKINIHHLKCAFSRHS